MPAYFNWILFDTAEQLKCSQNGKLYHKSTTNMFGKLTLENKLLRKRGKGQEREGGNVSLSLHQVKII